MNAGLVAVFALASAACASFSYKDETLMAKTARYPISWSLTLVDRDGIVKFEALKQVGTFSYAVRQCDVPVVDVSNEINRQVDKAGGQAVVGMRMAVQRDSGCLKHEFSGLIVQRAAP